ncbi:MAG: right-handed parallel beta-helix repeat-containing protein [Promethearchaeota archaeon]
MKRTKIMFLIVLVFVINILILSFQSYLIDENNFVVQDFENYNSNNEYIDKLTPKSSGSWTLNPFVIDDAGKGNYTWIEAQLQPWCTGSGTFKDPYVIENITINGGNSKSCLEIKNSIKYFVINNCTVYNSVSGDYSAGIKLNNTRNGKILLNNCSFNYGSGIFLNNSNNNTISGNQVNNNQGSGIKIFNNSNNNTISENILKFNNQHGLWMEGLKNRCENNTIRKNFGINNSWCGIFLIQCNKNTIIKNVISNNSQNGIYLHGCKYMERNSYLELY